jgi:large subunit ribosomal protein L10
MPFFMYIVQERWLKMKEVIKLKQKEVDNLSDLFSKSKSFLVFDYKGISAKQSDSIRKKAVQSGAKMLIAKNTLLKRALEKSNIQGFDQYLSGTSAIIFGLDDEVSPFKLVGDISKERDIDMAKIGFLENKIIDSTSAKEISNIPGRDGLYSMLASCLQSPIISFACAIKAIADKQQ